jgi:hypothetical protein
MMRTMGGYFFPEAENWSSTSPALLKASSSKAARFGLIPAESTSSSTATHVFEPI